MASQNAKIDQNNRRSLLGVTDDANAELRRLLVDASTGRLKVSAVFASQVTGPASSTDNAIARFDGTTGKIIQNSGVIISDTNAVTGALSLQFAGATSGTLTVAVPSTVTSYTITLPSAQGGANTFLKNDGSGGLSWDTSSSSEFADNVFRVTDNGDSTKKVAFEVSGVSTGTVRTLTVPNFDGTVATLAGTETFTNKTLTSPIISTISNTGTITLPTATDTLVGRATTDTLTNKTLTSPVLTTPQINDTSSDHRYVFAASELTADRTVTLPLLAGDDTFVFAAHTQTLTNKTLTTPTIGDFSNAGHNHTNAAGGGQLTDAALSSAVTVAKGGTGNTSLTAYAVLCGGTTGTGNVQSIASVGTSGQVLTSNGAGALPTFQNATSGTDISVRLTKSGTQNINTTEAAVTFDQEDFDTDTMHDNVTNNTRITFTTAGKYMVGASFMTDGNTTVGCKIRKDGSTIIARTNGANGNPQGYSTGTIYDFSATNYVELLVSTAANVNVTTETFFWAFKIN